MKKAFFIVSVLFYVNSYSQSESKKAKILEMISLTGVDKIGVQMMDNIMNSFRNRDNSIPDDFWIEVKKEVNSEELINLYVPIYDKYYTEEDLENLVKFYKSPTGKKVTSIMPQMMNESMEIGKKWGQELAQKVIQKLENRK
ncbi:DUF2059 domain-containing protein [Flavobacterium amnicola]|uniref:DUF2059 domain-containing protein n=1 Tax=Flavobacterium amnicola TaxID=2506422 RepID=A0A4Q1JZQ3_9FLAO|nr:DUF2059 domain-containing protein [Flavobacterium amnicola]RXR16216.1 DUF2059 domain-containing protein [Flavobacterium amnicola]